MKASPIESSYDVTQEVRIASVMFGGVSLAVYMNGITQELLRAVRATAPRLDPADVSRTFSDRAKARPSEALFPDADLQGTERVYRKLGQGLFYGRKGDGSALVHGGAIRTRIVVDMLAGTSAGGINSVYLAKALVNNYNLDELKQLWMDKADIDTLLNDARSDLGTYRSKKPPTSLLNSQRMYSLLFQAFEDMDQRQPKGQPLAEELDLWVTATDLDGIATPIQLADTTIEERIHKASFHFVYGPRRAGHPNDFTKQFNPMLAFASRCTSSFPIAFEPMTLQDVDARLPGLSLQIGIADEHPFRKFFAQFERNNPGLCFALRPLADGGYLNNKPFSFITDQIKVRTGSTPVLRKLLFLDPFPELDSEVRQTRQDIDFVQNALDAASTLPRYQTIREDIERLNEYNRGIHAAQALASEIENSLPGHIRECASETGYPPYQTRSLASMQEQYGRCYCTYHRLRVSAVTTDLAELATRLLGLNDRSDDLYAIRMLIHAWRRAHYSPEGFGGKPTENHFLFEYDLGFRFRRADYVRRSIDQMLAAVAVEGDAPPEALTSLIRTIMPVTGDPAAAAGMLLAARDQARKELLRLRDAIEDAKWRLIYERERLLLDPRGLTGAEKEEVRRKTLIQALLDTGIHPDDLKAILRPVRDDECQALADRLYAERPAVREHIEKAASVIAEWLKEILITGSASFRSELHRSADFQASVTGIVNEYASVHYEYFDCRDMQIFTALQQQLEGEGAVVEIYRVSPFDAVRLRTNSDPTGEQKLAGTALFAFGAFLGKEWRANDMMWGRLDGAERIVCALLPDEADEKERATLCAETFQIILEEEFTPHTCADLMRTLMDYLRQRVDAAKLKTGRGGLSAEEFLQLAMRDTAGNCPALIQQILRSIAGDADRFAVFKAYYVKPADPPIDKSLDRLRRALGIFRGMLRGLDGGDGPYSKLGGPIAGFGAALARFAEFSVPQTWPNVFLRYWVQLLYTISLVLIVTGSLLYKEVETAGWVVLGVTATLNVVSWLIGRKLRGAPVAKRIIGVIGALVVLVILVTAFLVRFQCSLPLGAWKAPLNGFAHAMDNRCATAASQPK